jgi:hypothetical protein
LHNKRESGIVCDLAHVTRQKIGETAALEQNYFFLAGFPIITAQLTAPDELQLSV